MPSLLLLVALHVPGQVELPSAKPITALQILPLPEQQASIQVRGHEISRYYFGRDLYRPFLFPIIGPSGRSLTRMGHPRDPNGHSHHNSLWVSHHDVGGVAFWNDARTSTGRIVHQRVNRYEESNEEAVIDVQNHWVDSAAAGRVVLEERRVMRFRPQAEGEWLLVLDITLTAPQRAVTLGKTNFGIVGIRMAKSIGVHDGGGMIRNSAGAVNEPQVHEKPARWVDYSGPMTENAREGITLLDHPQNPNHPAVFHVRDDGWMGAALTFSAPRTIEPGEPLTVRYGFWVHAGVPTPARIDEQFASFSQIGPVAK